MGGVSTARAPIAATVSKDTNSHRKTIAKVSVISGAWSDIINISCQSNSSVKKLQRVCSYLYFLRPPFSSSVSSHQMWMSACSLESVSTAAVSIWTAPTNAPVTMVTKAPQTAKPAKVCKGLSRAVGCNSPLRTSQLVALSRQQNNACKLFLFVRCQRVCSR